MMTADRRTFLLAFVTRYPKIAEQRANRTVVAGIANGLGYSLHEDDWQAVESFTDDELKAFGDGLDAGLPHVFHGGI